MDWKEVITTVAGSSVLTTLFQNILEQNKAKHKAEVVFIDAVRKTLNDCLTLSIETWATSPGERQSSKKNAILIDIALVTLNQQLGILYSSNPQLEDLCQQSTIDLVASLGSFKLDSPEDMNRHRKTTSVCSALKTVMDGVSRKHT